MKSAAARFVLLQVAEFYDLFCLVHSIMDLLNRAQWALNTNLKQVKKMKSE